MSYTHLLSAFAMLSSGMAAGLVKHDMGAALTLATLLRPAIFPQKSRHLKGGSPKVTASSKPPQKDGAQLATIQSDS